MKNILCVLLALAPLISVAQKTKTIEVAMMGYLNVLGEVHFKEDNQTPKDTIYYMIGADNQYYSYNHFSPYNYKGAIISNGSFEKIYKICVHALTLLEKEEVGVNLIQDDIRMSIRQSGGAKVLDIYYSDSPNFGIGYAMLTTQNISAVMARLKNYAQKNNVSLQNKK